MTWQAITNQCQRHNERDGVSFTSLAIVYLTVYSGADQSKHQSSASLTLVCEGNSPVTNEFPSQRASDSENISIWWRHHDIPWIMHTASYNLCFGIGQFHRKPPESFHWHWGILVVRLPKWQWKQHEECWALSQYKDRLIYVWRFPC